MRQLPVLACLLALIIATSGSFRQVQGQYPDDEVCHWQCDPVGCDYYNDYCDYDCYEVCYRAATNLQQTSSLKTVPKSSNEALKGISSPSFSLFSAIRNPHTKSKLAISDLMVKQEVAASKTGESVKMEPQTNLSPAVKQAQPKLARMRIMNPTIRVLRNNRLELTKVAPTNQFVLFEGALKN